MEVRPASVHQHRFWVEWRRAPDADTYATAFAHRVRGPLDVDLLHAAVQAVADRHEGLRVTHHAGPDGRLALRLHERLVVPLHREQGPVDDADAFVRRVRSLPFDLEHGAAVRLGVRSDGDEHLVVWVAHHVVFDGGAVRPFYDQVAEAWAALRAGGEVPRRSVPSLWAVLDAMVPGERGPDHDASIAWWARRLADGPLDVAVPGFAGSDAPAHHVLLAVPGDLRALAGSLGATAFEAVAAMWLALLHRVTGERDLAVSYPVRVAPRSADGVIASFVNNAVLRARIVPETSFARLVDDVHAERAACRPHQGAALADVVARLRREGVLGPDAPLLTVGVAETSFLAVPWALDGLEVTPLPAVPAEPVWDLALEIEREPLRLRLCARGSKYPRWFAESLAATWSTLAASMLADPLAPIAAAAWLPDADAARLAAWNDTWTVRPRESVATLLADAVARDPERVAVEGGGLSLTYGALWRRASGLARRLREVAGERAVIGLWGHPGAESVVGMAGIVAAGCAVLPLRPDDPPARILGMLADAGAVAVVGAGPPVGLPVVEAVDGEPWLPRVGPDDPIAVMFTSGSTGRPKGALVPHRGVVRLVRDTDWIALSPRDRILQSSDLAFDGATFDVWGALLNGATLVCAPKADLLDPARLAAVLRGVTVTFLTTGLFHRHAAADPGMFRDLRVLIVGGDVVDPGAVARVLAAGFAGRFLVAYGPTENTTYSTIEPVDSVGPGPLPIGRPIANTTAYVVAGGSLAPIGVPGELWLGGDGVALGYVGDPERTAERFVPNPWGARDPVLYRTGDRVRWLPDGRLDFLGRLDAQVKVRGFRVEPGEVDARARRHPGVRDAATVVVQHALVCWVVGDVGPDALRAWLAEGLPDYLVPAHVGRLDALPVNASGKVDRRALEALGVPARAAGEAAATPTERALAALWRDLLGVDAVSADDGFFRLGGDSLRAIDLVGRVRRDLGRELAVEDVSRHARLRDLAARIDARAPTSAPEPVPSGRPPPPTLPLSHFQVGQWFLMRRGMTYRTGTVLRIGAALPRDAIDAAWAGLTARHEVFALDVDLRRPRMVRHERPPRPVRHLALGADVAEAARRALEGATGCELTAWTGPGETWLALAMPHVLVDGFGLEVLARDLVDLLAGKALGEPPLPLHDLLDWEATVVTPAAIDAACAYYEARLVGDASVRVPRSVFGPRTTGTIGTLDPDAVARLAALARRRDATLEAVLAYCAFLAVHLAFRTEFVRCLSAYNNRDLVALRTLPFMVANGLWQQSRLDPLASFADAAVAFARDRAETFRHARLPPAVFFATSLSLFAWGRVRHLPGTAWLGRLWARGRPDRSWRLAAYVLDLVVASTVYRAWRAWVARSGSATIRTTGCFVNVTTSLSEPPALGGPWPVDVVRMPLEIPETVPGNPMIELYRDREGVRVLFQGLYAEGRTEAFVRLVEAVVRVAADDPDAPLGTLRDRLRDESAAFLG